MLFFDPKKAMKNITAEGITASAMYAITNSFLTVFAASLGANNVQIGLIVSIPALVTLLAYLPAAYLIERWNNIKMTCVISALFSRMMWFFVGLVPFLVLLKVVQGLEEMLMLLIAVLSVYSLFAAFVGPAWASMVGIIIPEKVRGSYFGKRNRLCEMASLIAGTLAGFIVQASGESLTGFAIIFIIAGAAGVASVFFFSRFPDIRFEPEKLSIFSEIKKAFKKKGFRRFLLIFMVWQLGINMSVPFFNVYLVGDLGGNYSMISFLIIAAGIATILLQRPWGTVSDIFGHRSILTICAFGIALIPLFWSFIPTPEFTILISILGGAAWAGFNIASFNYLLEVSSGERRTVYSSIFWTFTGITFVIAPVFGGIIIDAFMPVYMLGGFRGMFLVSFMVRMLSVVLFAYFLVEIAAPERLPTRHVAKEVINMGFGTIDRTFGVAMKDGLKYTHWLAMKLLSEINNMGTLPKKTNEEVRRIEYTIYGVEVIEESEYASIIAKLRRIRKRLRKRREKMLTLHKKTLFSR